MQPEVKPWLAINFIWNPGMDIMKSCTGKKSIPNLLSFLCFLENNSWIGLIFNRPRTYAYEEENYCTLRLSTMQEKTISLIAGRCLG